MSPCIEAVGSVNSSGYVYVCHKGKWTGAHRLAWAQAKGPVPSRMCVCHRCDNRKCINIEHLFLGTHSDNTRDMRAKGRGVDLQQVPRARGSRHGQTTLTEGWVAAGRAMRQLGMTYDAIAGELNTTRSTVHRFCTGKSWTHVR